MNKIKALLFLTILISSAHVKANQLEYYLPVSGFPITNLTYSSLFPLLSSGMIAEKPSAMNSSAYRYVHIGTNTDLFIDASETIWVAYNLDSSSKRTEQYSNYDGSTYTSSIPLTGILWLSFNTGTQAFSIYPERVKDIDGYAANFYPQANQSQTQTLFYGHTGFPDYTAFPGNNASIEPIFLPCIECTYSTRLNLAFLELRAVGSEYHLFASDKGHENVLSIVESFDTYKTSYSFNIAPVPLPSSIWLLGSVLSCLLAIVKRR